MNPSDIEGFILAGGASSRMGTDKAHLRLSGQSFVERIKEVLMTLTERISVVSSKPDAGTWGLPVVPDVYPNRGAMSGLHAALAHSQATWTAIVSCDLPFVTGELFRHLSSHKSVAVDAVVPLQEDGRPQPLCALYRTAECLDGVEALLRAGELRPRALLTEVRTRRINFDEMSRLAGAERFFLNVNTPEEYEMACRTAADFKA